MSAGFRKIRKITPFLAARSIDETIGFYTRHLGLRVAKLHPADGPTLVFLEVPGAGEDTECPSLIFDTSLWPGEPRMTGQLHVDFGHKGAGESRVLAVLDRIRPHTTVEWGPEVYHYGRRECSIKDPNGYSIVLSEETEEEPTDTDGG